MTKEIEDEEKTVIKVPSLLCEDKTCVDRVTEDIKEDVKVVIDVLPPSSKDKAYETLKLSNKRESLLEETTPTKAEVEVKFEIDSKPAKELENKMTNRCIIVETEEYV